MAKRTSSTKDNLVKVGAGALAVGTLVTGAIAIANNDDEKDKTPQKNESGYVEHVTVEKPSILDDVQFEPQKPLDLSPTLTTYGGEEYYMFSTEQILEIGRQSLAECEKVLGEVDGLRHFGKNGETVFPDFYDEYLIAGLAFTESSYRIYDEDENLLKSSANAYGLTQIKASTIDYVNWWMEEVMGLENPGYTIEDLKDPRKAMEITNYFNLSSILNYVRDSKPIYIAAGATEQGQKEAMIAIYNAGAGNVQAYAKSGTLHQYLSSGPKSNYVNKVLSHEAQIRAEATGSYEAE